MQRRFVDEYMLDCNAMAAGVRAGYSAKTINSGGPKLLTIPAVKAEIERRQATLSKKAEIKAEQVIAEFVKVGMANMGDYVEVDADGNVRLKLDKLPREAWAAVGEITQEEYTDGRGEDARPVKRTKFKLHPKIDALNSLAKHLGMFVERQKIEESHDHTVRILVEDARGNTRHVSSLRDYYRQTVTAPAPQALPAPDEGDGRSGQAEGVEVRAKRRKDRPRNR